jgi:hypothetical protein
MAIKGHYLPGRRPLSFPSPYQSRSRALPRPFPLFHTRSCSNTYPRASTRRRRGEVLRRRRCPGAVGPELTLLLLPLHSQDHQDLTAMPRSTQPRPQPPPRRAPVIPTTLIATRRLHRPIAVIEPLVSSVIFSSCSRSKSRRK